MAAPKFSVNEFKLEGDVLGYANRSVKGVENIVDLMKLVIKGERR